ncbi:MAG TPA: redoxin family protein [Solirubrobacteraceae bacterium]|nr:redoxin family protein [Solirubrobacteraceae bacterium]
MSEPPDPPPHSLDPEPPDPPPHSLDPERAVEEQLQRNPRQLPQPVIDTRPYRWAIGGFGILLVIVISIIEFANHGAASAGVKPGQRLIFFAAPVATSGLIGDANISKPCSLGYFGARAINTCLLVKRGPVVLGFFVAGVGDCDRSVDVIQSLSQRYASSGVQFVVVAASSSRTATLRDIRSHHWTIPVAYDRDGALAQVYGVEVCPMLELAYRGGVVKSLLLGDKWLSSAALAGQLRSLAASSS